MMSIALWLGSILRDRIIYLLTIMALLTFTLAYQVSLPAHFQIGGALDRPYAVNFQAPQKDGDARYRVTRAASMLVLPGLGGGIPRRVIVRTRLAVPKRPTELTIQIQGQEIGARNVTAQWQTDAYIVDSGPALSAMNWLITFAAKPAAGQDTTKLAVQKIKSRSAMSRLNRSQMSADNGKSFFYISSRASVTSAT